MSERVVCRALRARVPEQSCSYFRGMHEVEACEDCSDAMCEHIDAMDSGGSWYQAFIISRDEAKVRVHFNGWGSNVRPPLPPSNSRPNSVLLMHFAKHSTTRTLQPLTSRIAPALALPIPRLAPPATKQTKQCAREPPLLR